MHRAFSLLGLVACFLDPVPAPGQSIVPAGSLDFGMYYATLNGSDFGGVEPALGFDGVVRYRSPSVSLGLGYQWISHDTENNSSETRYIDGVYLEPRVSVPPVRGIWSTYVMGRAGRLFQEVEVDIDGVPTDLEAAGYTLGGGVGVSGQALFWALDVSVYYSFVRFEDFKSPQRGETFQGSAATGSGLGIRFGTAFVIGPWLWASR